MRDDIVYINTFKWNAFAETEFYVSPRRKFVAKNGLVYFVKNLAKIMHFTVLSIIC